MTDKRQEFSLNELVGSAETLKVVYERLRGRFLA
jgi:hypothetical protein